MDLAKLAAAKLWLTSPPPGRSTPTAPRDLPYLAHALYALVAIPDSEVPRMSVDEWWRVYVNEAWLETATVPEVGKELAHVVWHLLAEHAERARDIGVDTSTANFWKTASDVSIANTLQPEALGPRDLYPAAALQLPEDLSAEEYYALLSKLPPPDCGGGMLGPEDGCGSGADGIPRRNELGPDVDQASVSRSQAKSIRQQVAIEYNEYAQRSGRGETPGELLRWVREILQPTVAWEPLLGGAVRRAVAWAAGRGDYTYSRPSRRASCNPRVVLPGQQRPIPRVAIIVDTSGSVDDKLLARAMGEVDNVLLSLGVAGSEVTLYSVDAAVHTAQQIRRAKDAELVGAGGTDLRIGFHGVEEQRPRPDVVVCFTDGFTPWPEQPPPGAAVIIAMLGRRAGDLPPTPGWAVRVECLTER